MTQLVRNRALSFGNLLCVKEGLKAEMLPLPPACQTLGSPLDEGTAVGTGKASHLDPCQTLTWQEVTGNLNPLGDITVYLGSKVAVPGGTS